MTKTNEKIHVLADETLGGIKREYVEVDRKAEVGEKIVIVESESFPKGFIGTVDEFDDYFDDGSFDLIERYEGESFVDAEADVYHVLEPTDIVHIGTQRYELTDRKAEVGEKVIVVRPDGCIGNDKEAGSVGTVRSRYSDGDVDAKEIGLLFGTEYRVLVPLDKHKDTIGNKNSAYKELKNLIHNELGISRQDVQEMISIAVSNEVQKMSESGKLDRIAGEKIEALIEEGFRNGDRLLYGFKERVLQTVSDEVGKRIANVLNINVELKEGRN